MNRTASWILAGASALALACGDSESPSEAAAPVDGAGIGGSAGLGASGAGGAPASAGPAGSGTAANAGAGGSAGVVGSAGAAGSAGSAAGAGAGSGGTAGGATGSGGSGGMSGAGAGGGSGASGGGAGGAAGTEGSTDEVAAGLDELFVHDTCTGAYAPQPDTCLHALRVEREITIGGTAATTYEVTLRVRGIFEPTTINGGTAPLADHRYFKVGGTVAAADYSQWHIKVSSPAQTYWLNHYPSTSHTIFLEDFEATITVAGGSKVVVGATDGNDREIDNAEEGLADRRRLIEGVTDEVLDGQMLRLDVVGVAVK